MRFYNVQNVENLKNSEERLSYLEHRKVVDAIVAGESESAEKAMQEHLLIAYYSMLNPSKKPDINISEHEFDLGWE
jgi:DNA-binding FadR family transcriptional regulator